jgi:hypothetical protein
LARLTFSARLNLMQIALGSKVDYRCGACSISRSYGVDRRNAREISDKMDIPPK